MSGQNPAPSPRLGALLLAAGGSRRLGRPKQLIEIDGIPLVRRAASLLLGLAPVQTVVVVGAAAPAVSAALAGLELTVRSNPRWREGMGGSIAAGMAALPAALDGALIMPCDLWRLRAEDLAALRAAWDPDPDRIIASRWASAFGPPAIFPATQFDALRRLSGDAGARSLIERNAESVCWVRVDNAGFDLDDAADLARLS